MWISSKRGRTRVFFAMALFAVGLALCPTAALAANSDAAVAVNVDQAELVKLPERVATIVVGNPLIADVTMQPGNMVIVTGKSFGATNFIAMNRAGEILLNRIIQVEGPTDRVITVYRGVDRESYSCMPICQRRLTLGDGEAYFKSTMEQAGALNTQATGTAAKP
jgi:hypothetical protein